MKKLILGFLLLPVCAFAIDTADCADATKLAALYQVRAMMLRNYASYDVDNFIDKKLDELRVPLSGGGFQYVRWVKPSRDPEYDKRGHNVAGVQGTSTDNFESSGNNAFGVRVAVPGKRSLFSGNNAVWVGTVHVRYSAGGRERRKDEAINNWMNPDTTRTIDLGTIADHVEVSLDSATTEKNAKQALVEIHILKAVAQDDPANPNAGTITTLKKIRNTLTPEIIDDEIASLEPGDSFPLYRFVSELRRADTLIRSKKEDDQQKGDKLLKDTLRRLR
ncbi:MAG: hypothetical protein M3041_15470 [Acidobacteriota bacterium]|nr:hypothetical protein [Acidobacteriota bacterium]